MTTKSVTDYIQHTAPWVGGLVTTLVYCLSNTAQSYLSDPSHKVPVAVSLFGGLILASLAKSPLTQHCPDPSAHDSVVQAGTLNLIQPAPASQASLIQPAK